MTEARLTIRRSAPALKDDLLRYFEGAAFADNVQWKSCCCQFLDVDHAQVDDEACAMFRVFSIVSERDDGLVVVRRSLG